MMHVMITPTVPLLTPMRYVHAKLVLLVMATAALQLNRAMNALMGHTLVIPMQYAPIPIVHLHASVTMDSTTVTRIVLEQAAFQPKNAAKYFQLACPITRFTTPSAFTNEPKLTGLWITHVMQIQFTPAIGGASQCRSNMQAFCCMNISSNPVR